MNGCRSISETDDFLIVASAGLTFALPARSIVSVIDCPRAVRLPHMPAHARGIIDYRGSALPLFDLRRYMGWPTLQEEKDALIVTLRARKQDHLNWLAKLLDCVTKGAEVTVETDPHKCAFGRWYDTFTTTSASLGSYLKRFDDPHKTIHTIAVRAGELMARGEVEAAKALIHRSEGAELETLVSLFDGVEDVLGHHFSEYSVIVHQEAADAGSAPDDGPEMKADAAIAADRVEHFGTVDRIIQPAPFPPGTPGSELYLAIAVREREGTAEQSPVVDVERFLTGAAA